MSEQLLVDGEDVGPHDRVTGYLDRPVVRAHGGGTMGGEPASLAEVDPRLGRQVLLVTRMTGMTRVVGLVGARRVVGLEELVPAGANQDDIAPPDPLDPCPRHRSLEILERDAIGRRQVWAPVRGGLEDIGRVLDELESEHIEQDPSRHDWARVLAPELARAPGLGDLGTAAAAVVDGADADVVEAVELRPDLVAVGVGV
jgi:hypothetical protein